MIDNVVLIVTGTLHERDVQELLEKCHPLGMFDRYYHAILFSISHYSPTKDIFMIFMDLTGFFLRLVSFYYYQHCYPGSCTKHAGTV